MKKFLTWKLKYSKKVFEKQNTPSHSINLPISLMIYIDMGSPKRRKERRIFCNTFSAKQGHFFPGKKHEKHVVRSIGPKSLQYNGQLEMFNGIY